MKSISLGIEWLWQIKFIYFNVRSVIMAKPSNSLQGIYIAYIAPSVLSLVITYNLSVLLTSNTDSIIHYTIYIIIITLFIYYSTLNYNSYFSRMISDLNMLTIHLIEVADTDTFKTELQSLL